MDQIDELESAVCKFLRIATIDQEPQMAIAVRKSTDYGYENSAQVAWYMRARALAERAPVTSAYKESNFEDGVADLLRLSSSAEDVRRVPSVLGEMGIRLVLLQHLAKTKIEGAAFWLDDTSPAIALSLRYDRIDNFLVQSSP